MMPQGIEAGARGKRRSIVRTVTVGGKFTEIEAQALAKQAAQRGQLLGEWARESLLSNSREQTQEVEGIALFAEVQALRLVLINTLEPLLRGDKMSAEQFNDAVEVSVQARGVGDEAAMFSANQIKVFLKQDFIAKFDGRMRGRIFRGHSLAAGEQPGKKAD